MFYFYADKSGKLEKVESRYVLKKKRTFSNLSLAREKKNKRILVVDTAAMPVPRFKRGLRRIRPASPIRENEHKATTEPIFKRDDNPTFTVPTWSIRNIKPYMEPFEVEAGGGIITRLVEGRLQILLILRRGVWDLPKGKLDPGETIAECALREVREELGISKVKMVRTLDVTVHGYPERKAFRVKTTHWYQMKTKEEKFTPEKREGIKQVKWFPWKKAERRLGYENLRELLVRVRPMVTV